MSKQAATEQLTVEKEAVATAVRPAKVKPRLLPPFKVILHNDDKNTMEDVIAAIIELTPLKKEDALLRTLEAHETGCALLLVTHRERAELYAEQFQSKSLTVTIEPDGQ
jgi:ATP-dependent Clp protease adaptor protein ClpS